jgi:tetratricopeptide (TPR) repeat protein
VTEPELRKVKRQLADAVNQEDLAEAEEAARAVLDAHEDASLTDGRYLEVWESWANALQRLGQHTAAAREYTTMIEGVGPVIGHDHAMVVLWRIKRAAQLAILARYEEAERESRASIQAAQMPGTVPDSARQAILLRLLAVHSLVVALIGQGMAAEAESVARTSIAEAASITDVPEGTVVVLHQALAASLSAQDRDTEAIKVLRGQQPRSAPSIASFNITLGTARLGAGQVTEAEASAREAVVSAERFYAPVQYTALQAGTLLGAVLVRRGDLAEARRLLRSNAAAWAEHFGKVHPRTIDARRELARTHDARW